MLPKALEGMKVADIRALSLKDLVAKFTDGDTPTTVEELKGIFQEDDLAAIAAALGLGEEATVADILAAIKGLVEGAAAAVPEGEMKVEMKKATDRIAVLESDKLVREWEDRTRDFNAIPGTPHEHAVSLADIERKVSKETAETQFKALEQANRLAADATVALGTSRKAEVTDFDAEVTKYQADNKDVTKGQAIKAVAKARPDLYFARRK